MSRFVTLPTLARTIGVSEGPLRRRIERGELKPDATAVVGALRPETPLFLESSIPALRQKLFMPETAIH